MVIAVDATRAYRRQRLERLERLLGERIRLGEQLTDDLLYLPRRIFAAYVECIEAGAGHKAAVLIKEYSLEHVEIGIPDVNKQYFAATRLDQLEYATKQYNKHRHELDEADVKFCQKVIDSLYEDCRKAGVGKEAEAVYAIYKPDF